MEQIRESVNFSEIITENDCNECIFQYNMKNTVLLNENGERVCQNCGLILTDHEAIADNKYSPQENFYPNRKPILSIQGKPSNLSKEQLKNYKKINSMLQHKHVVTRFMIINDNFVNIFIERYILPFEKFGFDNWEYICNEIKYYILKFKNYPQYKHYAIILTIFYYLYMKKLMDLKQYIAYCNSFTRLTLRNFHSIKNELENLPVKFNNISNMLKKSMKNVSNNVNIKNITNTQCKIEYIKRLEDKLNHKINLLQFNMMKKRVQKQLSQQEFSFIKYQNEIRIKCNNTIKIIPYEKMIKYSLKGIIGTVLSINTSNEYYQKNIAKLCGVTNVTISHLKEII
ncbi:MAG: hypothetical protein WC934_01965 [Acidithiobacillus sp.]|jgi:hypothetical protein|uniref:hypothetical protein n=1 Tax=Acidithiobacillus sp. TaxID=1872118 RepID=UPI00355F4593